VPSVADIDASAALDGNETESVPSVTVTGNSVTDGGGNPGQGLVMFDAGQVLVVPGMGGAARVFGNPVVVEVYAGVMVPVVLPDTNLAFPTSFTYTVTLRLEGADSDLVVGSVEISRLLYPSATCDLSELL